MYTPNDSQYSPACSMVTVCSAGFTTNGHGGTPTAPHVTSSVSNVSKSTSVAGVEPSNRVTDVFCETVATYTSSGSRSTCSHDSSATVRMALSPCDERPANTASVSPSAKSYTVSTWHVS